MAEISERANPKPDEAGEEAHTECAKHWEQWTARDVAVWWVRWFPHTNHDRLGRILMDVTGMFAPAGYHHDPYRQSEEAVEDARLEFAKHWEQWTARDVALWWVRWTQPTNQDRLGPIIMDVARVSAPAGFHISDDPNDVSR